jgi:hypothetical protein
MRSQSDLMLLRPAPGASPGPAGALAVECGQQAQHLLHCRRRGGVLSKRSRQHGLDRLAGVEAVGQETLPLSFRNEREKAGWRCWLVEFERAGTGPGIPSPDKTRETFERTGRDEPELERRLTRARLEVVRSTR